MPRWNLRPINVTLGQREKRYRPRSAAHTSRVRVRALLAGLMVSFIACGGGVDTPTTPKPPITPPPPPGPVEAAAPTASSTTLGSMQEIELSGLPTGRVDLQADVTVAGSGTPAQPGSYQMPLFPTANGRYRLVIPLHPTAGVQGGSVDVRVRAGGSGGSLVTAPLRLTLAPLPPAPGAFAAVVDSLQLLVDLALENEGLTRADVLVANARDLLPKRLLPLAIVQRLLDDPSHNRDLRDLLRGSAAFTPLLGGAAFDRDLLDRLVSAAGLPAYWKTTLAAARATRDSTETVPAVMPMKSPFQTSAMQGSGGITNAYNLSVAMRRAADAKRAIDPRNPQAQVREHAGLLLGVAGIFTGPAAGGVIAGVSMLQFMTNTVLEVQAKTLPSEFVENSMSFDVDIPRFFEDEPGPGRYRNVKVSAKSEGMVLDKVILNSVLQVVGGVRSAGGLFQGAPGPKSVMDWVTDVQSFMTETTVGLVPDADGLLRIPPETWTDIDLSGAKLWTRARVTGTAISADTFPTYRPIEAGNALLTVETKLAIFGGAEPATARQPIEVAPIQIELIASKSTVTPGDIVSVDIRVVDALDPGLEWTLSAGTWASGPTYLGSNLWKASIQTPKASGVYPINVIFTSTATGGARSTPSAPKRTGTLRMYTGNILVEPANAALMPGELQQFTATVLGLENKAVTWSAIGPTGAPVAISATGVFTAPTLLGEYQVTATSVQDPMVKGTVLVTVMGTCSWSLTIGSAFGGTWSGVDIGHFYPDQPQGGGGFRLSFDREGKNGDVSTGLVQAIGPRIADATGNWPATFGFTPKLGTSGTWMAIPESATYVDTDARLAVTANTGTIVRGRASGVAMLGLGAGQVQYAPFALVFSSAREFNCGPP